MVCKFEKYLRETDSIYDLIANCFGILCDNIENHQAFIGEYMSEGVGVLNNPNLKMLKTFSERIMDIVSGYEPSTYDVVKEQILETIRELNLEDYLDERLNQLTVIYCILSAIDCIAMEWRIQWMHPLLGPLDKNGKTNYRVYFSPRDTLHEQFVDGIKRKRVSASKLFENFTNFRFVDERCWREEIAIPQVRFVRLPKHVVQDFKTRRKLKVAVIPVSKEMNFEFAGVRGCGVGVKYLPEMEKREGERICDCIEKAAKQGAHMIILPEYTISPLISKKVKIFMGKMYRERKEEMNLLLVFAGSTWTEDNNNVMEILDAMGNVLGEYYKYSPFTKEKAGEYGFEQYEALANPGKRCDLIGIEGVGVVLPAICRDVIDGEYTVKLAEMLLPIFVAIASWSPSVASFKPRMEELANKYFSSAILCNACSAVQQKQEKVGMGSIVTKQETIAGCDFKNINRADCGMLCEESTCVYFLEYDFSFSADLKNTQLSCYRYGA